MNQRQTGTIEKRAEGMTLPELRRRLDEAEADLARRFLAGASLADLRTAERISYATMRGILERRIGRERYRAACLRNMREATFEGALKRGARPWTRAEETLLRRAYRRRTGRSIAAELGRPVHAVRQKASALGLAVPQRFRQPGFIAFLRARNAAGWSDTEIAAGWGCDRHAVTRARRRLGLPSNAHSERVRAKIRQAAAAQCRREGVANLGALRREIYRRRARAAGWPEDLRWRSVQMLNALWDHGPMTRRQFAEAIGMPWKGSRASLSSNDPEGSYLAHLMARGLVVTLGPIFPSRSAHGTPTRVHVYSLPLGIQRSIA